MSYNPSDLGRVLERIALLGSREGDSIAQIKAEVQRLSDMDDRALAFLRLVEGLVGYQKWHDALLVARDIAQPVETVSAFNTIAAGMINHGVIEEIDTLLAEAEAIAGNIKLAWQRAEALGCIAHNWTLANRRGKALEAWLRAVAAARLGEGDPDPQNSLDASSVLWDIAVSMARYGEIGLALSTSQGIRNSHKRQRAISDVNRLMNASG